MAESKQHKDAIFWMSGGYSTKDLQIRRAIVKEKLGTLTETRIEFQCAKTDVDVEDLLGQPISLHLNTTSGIERKFHGHCVSVENLGLFDGYMQLVAELRPWPWFLTRARNNRIFQEKNVEDIIKEVFSDQGFSDYSFNLSDKPKLRTYCVQYDESDFDFVSRLMEEEGIYYWFDYSGSRDKMMIVDGRGGHSPIEGESKVTYKPRSDSTTAEFLAEFTKQRAVRTGKVTLDDYHFETPKAQLKVSEAQQTPAKKHKAYEAYDVPGRFRALKKGDTDLGKKYAKAMQQAEDTDAFQFRGAGNVPRVACGRTMTVKEHETKEYNEEFLVTEAVHYIQTQSDYEQQDNRRDLALGPDPFPENMKSEVYNVTFGSVLASKQYRSLRKTPWPRIPGIQTAKVVGKGGEEIYTDEHGRIKVQFHWDRDGQNNEKSSCWVRVVTPWSGKNWGMIHIPRIGQEVVIQFEDGNPDRPICTGCLYNKDTMPPYPLPANMTQSGIKTNSSKGGGGFNELMWEDKKGEELVRFQSEKDYQQIVKNNATITVGEEKQDPGDLSLTVYNDSFETIRQNKTQEVGKTYNQTIGDTIGGASVLKNANKLFGMIKFATSPTIAGQVSSLAKKVINAAAGNVFNQTINGVHTHVVTTEYNQVIGVWHTQTVAGKYSQTVGSEHKTEIGGDKKETVHQDVTVTFKGKSDLTVEKDVKEEIKGKQEVEITKDLKTTIKSGNIKTDVKAGKIEVKAAQSIEMKVGTNSIKIDQTGVTIKGNMVKIEGKAMAEMKSKLTTVKADAMLTLKGGVTMIN